MADNARDDDDRGRPPADEAALSARLRRLGERLDKVHASRPVVSSPGASPPADSSAMARGFRLSTELVGGVLLGAALGWLLDRWLGSSPWGLIGLVLLGFAGGVLNVMRAAGVVSSGGLNGPHGPKGPH
jgi:ATP synthase protein I